MVTIEATNLFSQCATPKMFYYDILSMTWFSVSSMYSTNLMWKLQSLPWPFLSLLILQYSLLQGCVAKSKFSTSQGYIQLYTKCVKLCHIIFSSESHINFPPFDSDRIFNTSKFSPSYLWEVMAFGSLFKETLSCHPPVRTSTATARGTSGSGRRYPPSLLKQWKWIWR